MRTDPSSVTTSNSVPAEFGYRGGEFGELVIIYNPATNTNRIWAALNRDATTAGVTGQTCIAPGQYAFFILTQEDNRSGINVIAETGTTVVTVQRQSFRSRLELVAVMGGLYGGAVAGQYWVAVSGTAVKLAGAYTEAQMDRLDAKTGANGLSIGPSVPSGGTRIGNTTLTSGQLRAGIDDNNAHIWTSSGHTVTQSGSEAWHSNATDLGPSRLASFPFVAYNSGGADPRVAISGSRLGLNTPVAGGAIDSQFITILLPIANTAVVAAGDIVEFATSGSNAVSAAAAGTTNFPIGKAISGGTGNAGGTVMAEIIIWGLDVSPSLLADTAGTTFGQYIIPGATTANRVQSVAAPTAQTFARALSTTAAGNNAMIFYRGGMGG